MSVRGRTTYVLVTVITGALFGVGFAAGVLAVLRYCGFFFVTGCE